ncbi:hypothetical protein J2744_000064 [Halorubrum trapanicum]|uniref:Uncharacterized protein n=1 Tax=Halorubrum trapanicum TaxID=29284 RepID=A0A8J7RR30_9EURY|nr:hypothetical protein [Halorubrum trapanicum]
MRLAATRKPDLHKCRLMGTDLEGLRCAAGSHREDLVIQLGGFVGLHAFETHDSRRHMFPYLDDGHCGSAHRCTAWLRAK